MGTGCAVPTGSWFPFKNIDCGITLPWRSKCNGESLLFSEDTVCPNLWPKSWSDFWEATCPIFWEKYCPNPCVAVCSKPFKVAGPRNPCRVAAWSDALTVAWPIPWAKAGPKPWFPALFPKLSNPPKCDPRAPELNCELTSLFPWNKLN